ncbi:MAG TPA: bifunctional DNA primase/polymerase [Gemmataceae bacterium]|nr:bifunctional DNA primase/polymerase [Gemmataceae bacterium]
MMIDTAPALKPEDLGNHTLDVALAYLGSGLSIIPVARDGTKQPDARLLPREYDDDTGHFKATWNPFKDHVRNGERVPGRLPTEKEVQDWFGRPNPPGIGVIGGAVSGGLECLDFDTRAEQIFRAWCEMVESEAPGLLAKLSIAKTPKPGYHVRYRCSEVSIPGNTKLAEDPALPPKERT